jgi:predicted aspartyl protease
VSTTLLKIGAKVDTGRITAHVTIQNSLARDFVIECDAMVDTGATYLTLPSAWRDRLGELQTVEKVQLETASQAVIEGEICGPVRVSIEGFRGVNTDVLFIDMEPRDGRYDPLIGYLVLEAIPAAVDMLGHRLMPVKYADLK